MTQLKVPISLIALTALLSGLAIYSYFVEPNWIEVTHHKIEGSVGASLKIAHLTDLHLRAFGRMEKRALEMIDKESPDIIVLTGDSIEESKSIPFVKNFFTGLHAPLGVWVVRGNWENWAPISNEHEFYRSLGVNFLLNEIRRPRSDLTIMGFDDAWAGNPSRAVASERELSQSNFCIALFHSPQFFDYVAGHCNLSLAGHTHGGQVKLPLLGPIWLPQGVGDYLEGWYEKKGSRLYVNRGLGTSILPIRFLSRPEIAFITVARNQ